MGQKVSYVQSGDAKDELKKLKLNTGQKGHEEHCKKNPSISNIRKEKGKNHHLCVNLNQKQSGNASTCQSVKCS